MYYLGLGKTLFNSAACVLHKSDVEIFLTERLTRKKASGSWPSTALLAALKSYPESSIQSIAENRDVEDPTHIEELLNSQFPFYESLEKQNLKRFTRRFNSKILFLNHHLAHAYAASYMSPYDKALILVIDGAGSRLKYIPNELTDFSKVNKPISGESAEERSVYSLNNGNISCLQKEFQTFIQSDKYPEHYFSYGLGTFYEKISEYIFNSKRSAGKVMGLAPLGNSQKIEDSVQFLENLNWARQFTGKSKLEWETHRYFEHYCDIAATVQNFFEEDYLGYITSIKKAFPEYENLIITGGCALNCTSNMKLINLNLFRSIYIPPFPGDESISLGAAHYSYLKNSHLWQKRDWAEQHGYFGPKSSVPKDEEIVEKFANYEITKPEDICAYSAKILSEGHVIAWFQGRSESGPRALGNRSILARADKVGIKDYLNNKIKFRETFRPYGSSVLHEKSSIYFDVPHGFDNPYMSFACPVKAEFKTALKEVTHVDNTSRMQTVRRSQNPIFYDLILKFGQLTNIFCLLNTSLNIMGEPIIETIDDAKKFLDTVPVHGMAIGSFFIRKK